MYKLSFKKIYVLVLNFPKIKCHNFACKQVHIFHIIYFTTDGCSRSVFVWFKWGDHSSPVKGGRRSKTNITITKCPWPGYGFQYSSLTVPSSVWESPAEVPCHIQTWRSLGGISRVSCPVHGLVCPPGVTSSPGEAETGQSDCSGDWCLPSLRHQSRRHSQGMVTGHVRVLYKLLSYNLLD